MRFGYSFDELREFLDNFYTFFNIRVVVFDSEFVKIAEAPGGDCGFCTLVRGDPYADELCRRSDSEACLRCRDLKRPYSYTCHAGLTEIVMPIHHGNIVAGYIMFGQMLLGNSEEDWGAVARRCSAYNVDMGRLREAFFGIRTVTRGQLDASAQILEACAIYVWRKQLFYPIVDSLPKRIDEYISNNLQADLSAGALCKLFSISRSKLYKIAGEYYGCGIEQLTRRLRIDYAKDLLVTTNHPVSEIAYQTGYREYNYFIKVFKKETGMTPTQYRKFSFSGGGVQAEK